jgi:hypothetical protein
MFEKYHTHFNSLCIKSYDLEVVDLNCEACRL